MVVRIPVSLPPLRHKILRSFSVLIALYAVLGVFMTAAVFLASGTSPKLLHVNYDSIAAAQQLHVAWQALENPKGAKDKPAQDWINQFERALTFAEGNVTEPGERDLTKDIRSLWVAAKPRLPAVLPNDSVKLYELLERLVAVNESGMFRLAEDATTLGHRVFLASLLFFFVTLGLALLLADGLAARLARPLKEIAEALREGPSLGRRLKLPEPSSLEVRILTNELTALWQRLGQFQKLNLEELEAQRERLETILASVEDAILVLDNQGQVLHCSDGMLKVLGVRAEQVLGLAWTDLSTNSANYLILRGLLYAEMPPENSVELTVAGKNHVLAGRHRSIATGAGQKLGELYLLHDITEVKQRERLRNEFIGVLSHELKTPLQSLGTASELLSDRKAELTEDTRMLADTIHEDVARIRAVANDFIQVGLVDLHSLQLKLEKKPLNHVLKEWAKPFQILAQDKGVKFEFISLGSETIWANIDVVKLPWAVSNLLANAIRISEPGAMVTLSVTDRAELAQIEIRDEGPGIPAAVQQRMFEPYYQAPASEAGTSNGFLGLGLTIAKEVVEAHEGQLEYFERKPRGSVFRISLPYLVVYS